MVRPDIQYSHTGPEKCCNKATLGILKVPTHNGISTVVVVGQPPAAERQTHRENAKDPETHNLYAQHLFRPWHLEKKLQRPEPFPQFRKPFLIHFLFLHSGRRRIMRKALM